MTLLIADDERTIREGIASAIDWGALGITRVLQASNGKKALAAILAEKPDIAIVDILMPEMGGMELISRCVKIPDRPEFVIISGHDEFKYAQEAVRNHVHNYILKPCDTEEITETIRKIVRELELRRSQEADRRELQERLDVLMPQSRELLFQDFISGGALSPARLQVLRQLLPAGTERFVLLLFYAGDPDDQRKLAALKKVLDLLPELAARLPGAAVSDSLVYPLDAVDRGTVDGLAERLRQEGRLEGCLAAVSAPGGFESLPKLYLVTREAARRAFLTMEPGSRPLVLETSASPYSAMVQKAMRYIEEHFADASLSLGKAAKEALNLNCDYLGKLFKKECGLTFGEYLMAVRMERARRIIASSDDVRIYEAAWQVGFGDDSAYFSQVFRKHTGCAPGEYRKRHAG